MWTLIFLLLIYLISSLKISLIFFFVQKFCILFRLKKEQKFFDNFKKHTALNGINAFNVFVSKPFLSRPDDAEKNRQIWHSGELFTLYHDWIINSCSENYFLTATVVEHRISIVWIFFSAQKTGENNINIKKYKIL